MALSSLNLKLTKHCFYICLFEDIHGCKVIFSYRWEECSGIDSKTFLNFLRGELNDFDMGKKKDPGLVHSCKKVHAWQ